MREDCPAKKRNHVPTITRGSTCLFVLPGLDSSSWSLPYLPHQSSRRGQLPNRPTRFAQRRVDSVRSLAPKKCDTVRTGHISPRSFPPASHVTTRCSGIRSLAYISTAL